MHAGTRPEGHFGIGEAFALFAVSMVALVVAAPFIAPLGLPGHALSQIAFLGLPPLLLAWVRGRSAGRVLAIHRPSGRALAASIFLGTSLWIVLLLVVLPFTPYLAGEEEVRRLELQIMEHPLWLRLVVIAVVPAVCEELLFRGALARAIAARLGDAPAILLSALLFGLFHIAPVRILPTAVLGIFLAWLCLRTGSIVPSMVLHGLNNAIVVTLAGLTLDDEALRPWISVLVVGGFALTVVGVWMVARSPRPRG